VGPGNLSRWRFEARRAPTWTAQAIAPLPTDATVSHEDRAYAALIERVFERAITQNASCFDHRRRKRRSGGVFDALRSCRAARVRVTNPRAGDSSP
jgi:hypothetical protein